MHIYIIAQELALTGQEEDRLYKLGKEYAGWGHEVTVFTTAGDNRINFKGKKINLLQKDGVNFIYFNISIPGKMLARYNLWGDLKYALLTGAQGKKIPSPDIIFVSSPPLTALLPAMKLCNYYSVPLVTEIRRIWPNGSVHPKRVDKKVLNKAVYRFEQKVYEKSDHIIVWEEAMAEEIIIKLGKNDRAEKVSTVSKGLEGKELIDAYDTIIAGLLKDKD